MKENNNEERQDKKLKPEENNQNVKRGRKSCADNDKEQKSPQKKYTKKSLSTDTYEESQKKTGVPATSKSENKAAADVVPTPTVKIKIKDMTLEQRKEYMKKKKHESLNKETEEKAAKRKEKKRAANAAKRKGETQ